MKPYIMGLILMVGLGCKAKEEGTVTEVDPIPQPEMVVDDQLLSKAYFASGCFWCVEAVYESVSGVLSAVNGYAGGTKEDATYEKVSSGRTNHAETVEVLYDPRVISYETLLKVFFGSHDPTTLNRQGPDSGPQYRSAIFYKNESEKAAAEKFIQDMYTSGDFKKGSITTEVVPFNAFYPAEDYHQDYEKLNPNQPYIRAVSVPRLKAFMKQYPELLKGAENH